jgi:hypothetical protein
MACENGASHGLQPWFHGAKICLTRACAQAPRVLYAIAAAMVQKGQGALWEEHTRGVARGKGE